MYNTFQQEFLGRIKDYTGRIDNNPRYNVAAQVNPNIASSRGLEFKEDNKLSKEKK